MVQVILQVPKVSQIALMLANILLCRGSAQKILPTSGKMDG
jgi:hypothetical protein